MGKEKKLHALPDGGVCRLLVESAGPGHRVVSEEPRFEADVARAGDGVWSVLVSGRSYEAFVRHADGEIHVEVGGERFRFGMAGDRSGPGASARSGAASEVKAPMPGKVVKLLVAAGDRVSAGQGVLLFEAMKMQNEIRSPSDGVLSEVTVEEGQAVEAREKLFVVRPE